MDRAMDAWVDGGTLPRRPPVGRRRQRGFHGVHGAHQRVWAGSSEAAAGTAGRRHRLSLGLREALERRVRGGRPRRGRGGVGGQPHRLRDPPSLRGRDLARGAGRHEPPPLRAALPRRPPRPHTSPGRRAPRASPAPAARGNHGDFPGEGTRPPARHFTQLPGVFPTGPGSGGLRGHRSFRFLPAPREGGGDGVAARKRHGEGEHLRRACPRSREPPPGSYRPPAPLASGDSPLRSFPSGTTETGPGAGPPNRHGNHPHHPQHGGGGTASPARLSPAVPSPGAPALTAAAAAQDGPGGAGRARLRGGCAGSSAASGRCSAGGAGPGRRRRAQWGRALISMQAPPPARQARLAERRRVRAAAGERG